MPLQSRSVIPIRRSSVVSETDQDVVDFAYNLWLARAFRGGSPGRGFVRSRASFEKQNVSGPFLGAQTTIYAA
jgi:hypothetical protein